LPGVTPDPFLTVRPSPHALALAGVDLLNASPPVVRVDEAGEIAVVLSRSRDPRREVFLERCADDSVPVVVRPSGGGAVVLAPGTVAASVVLPAAAAERFPEPHFRRLCGAVAAALSGCGVRGISMRGVSDLCLSDRKIAGSSLRLWRERLLFQIAVLVDSDTDLLERYLRHPSREPEYRRGRSHRDFVTSLRAAGFRLTAAEASAALRARLEREAARC
jgi:lipoate-protein ligase A